MQDAEVFSGMHKARFGAKPAVFAAPGRVNLIGEHTDYAEGFVMPAAIDFATLAGITPRVDGKIVLYSENYEQQREFSVAELPAVGTGHWTDYPIGVVSMLAGEGHAIPGFSLSLWGDVPLGSGLSSSAAVEVATALAVSWLIGENDPGMALAAGNGGRNGGARLARLCQRAENEFVGANCGIMDQFISVNGAENHALLLDCRDLSFKLAPIPPRVALVIANTMVKHSVAGGDYATRRAEVEAACAAIARHRPEVKFLRDATVDDLDRWGGEMTPESLKRARHIVTENMRTVDAAEALIRGDVHEVGRLMAEAHASYSHDFEASCAEADAMVELAQDLPGLIGARLTGGGFGGCTVNLVESQEARGFAENLRAQYVGQFGIVPQIHISRAAGGAHRIE